MAFNCEEMDCCVLARSPNRGSFYSEPSFCLPVVSSLKVGSEQSKTGLTFISTAEMNTTLTRTQFHFPSINKKSDSIKHCMRAGKRKAAFKLNK